MESFRNGDEIYGNCAICATPIKNTQTFYGKCQICMNQENVNNRINELNNKINEKNNANQDFHKRLTDLELKMSEITKILNIPSNTHYKIRSLETTTKIRRPHHYSPRLEREKVESGSKIR